MKSKPPEFGFHQIQASGSLDVIKSELSWLGFYEFRASGGLDSMTFELPGLQIFGVSMKVLNSGSANDRLCGERLNGSRHLLYRDSDLAFTPSKFEAEGLQRLTEKIVYTFTGGVHWMFADFLILYSSFRGRDGSHWIGSNFEIQNA